MIRIIFLLVMKITLSSTSVFACEEKPEPPKLSLAESKQLLANVQYLLSDKETIDYEDPRLNEILNKYEHKYKLFKIYKAFIEFDKSNKTKEDINRADEILSSIHFFGDDRSSDDTTMDKFFALMTKQHTGEELKTVICNELPGDIRQNVLIPLWLISKHPDIMNYAYGRWSIAVNAKVSVRDLPFFRIFEQHVEEATGNYWRFDVGSRSLDVLASRQSLIDKISFAPILLDGDPNSYTPPTPTELYSSFDLWSYEGIWNRLKYKQVFRDLDKAASELAEYYRNNYNLEKHAAFAKQILLKYIQYEIPGALLESNPPIESNWYPDFFGYYQTIDKLEFFRDDINSIKIFTQKLTHKEKGFVLFYSVLKNYDTNFIQWLIDSGADINVMPCGETPLMASVTNSGLTQVLVNSGADIRVGNRFGKNVLFYAVQFGNKEVVKILLENGGKAIINSKINVPEITQEKEQMKRQYNEYTFHGFGICPHTVHEFTPLIYAKRYASKDIIDLLIARGAKDGPADPEKVKKWINEGPLDW